MKYTYLLPGETPWTDEPGGLQFMGLHRVRYSVYIHTHIYMCISLSVTIGLKSVVTRTKILNQITRNTISL